MKLIQKNLLKGTQEFELRDEEMLVNIKSPLKSKEKSIPLEILNPEPQVDGSYLHFYSRVKCGPLISLYLNKPNKKEFDAFVEAVKEKALKEYNSFAGINADLLKD